MLSASTVRRSLVGLAAAAVLLAATTTAVLVSTASTARSVQVAAVTDPAPEARATTTSSTSTPTSTSTSSTSTTSTTVKLRPTTTAPPRTTVPATTPATSPAPAPAPAAAPAPAGGSAEERCAVAQRTVAASGLVLPVGWGFRCPGRATMDGVDRWGIACWNCEGAGSWIAVDIARIGASDATLRYVIAHETCHANDYATLGISTEVTADLCAALHGAPHP